MRRDAYNQIFDKNTKNEVNIEDLTSFNFVVWNKNHPVVLKLAVALIQYDK